MTLQELVLSAKDIFNLMIKGLATINRFFPAPRAAGPQLKQTLLPSASSMIEGSSSARGDEHPPHDLNTKLIVVSSRWRSPPHIQQQSPSLCSVIRNLFATGRSPPSDDTPSSMANSPEESLQGNSVSSDQFPNLLFCVMSNLATTKRQPPPEDPILPTTTTKPKRNALQFSHQKNPFYSLVLRNSYSTTPKTKLERNLPINFYGKLQSFENLFKEEFFIDKTTDIGTFESAAQSMMVTSPRRTGKSILVDMIDDFYNLEYYEFVPIPQNEVESSKKQGADVQKQGQNPECSTETRENYQVRWRSHDFNPFASLKISQHSSWDKIKQKQGRFPVIRMDFKNFSSDSKDSCISNFISHLQQTFKKFSYLNKYQEYTDLMNSLQDLRNQMRKGQPILETQKQTIEQSLKLMTELLHHHHGKRVMILIDEYDRPFRNFLYKQIELKYEIKKLEIKKQQWSRKGEQKQKNRCQNQLIQKRDAMKRCQEDRKDAFVLIIRTLGAAYKGNNSLEKGLLVGIFQVLMKKAESALNNVQVYTMENGDFNTAFGLTEKDVKEMIEKLFNDNHPQLLLNIKKFYNGYLNKVNLEDGGQEDQKTFNTYSVMKYLGRCFKWRQVEDFRSFWTQTGSSIIIKTFFQEPKHFFLKSRILSLDRQVQTPVKIATSLDLGNILNTDPSSQEMQGFIIHALYNTGLLTGRIKDGILYARIPNEQISRKFEQEFQSWAKTALGGDNSRINFFNLGETIAKIHSSLLCYQEYVDKHFRESAVQGIVFVRWFISEQQRQKVFQEKQSRFYHLILPIQHGTSTQLDSSGQTGPRAENTAIIHVYKNSLGYSPERQYKWGLRQILERGYIETLFEEKAGKRQIKDPSIKYVILRSIVFVQGKKGKNSFIYHNAKDETFTIEQAEQLLELKGKEAGQNIQEIQKTILEKTKKSVNMEGSSFGRGE